MKRLPLSILLAAMPSAAFGQDPDVASALRYQSLQGNIRGEVHMLPPVSAGPMSPSWSPDGQSLVFAMAGDLWRAELAGPPIRQITQGPAYYFEPAWSPDGRWIAASLETGDGLDIALVDPNSGEARILVSNAGVDVQPAWGPEGRVVYFASVDRGSFDIRRVDVDTGEQEVVVGGRGNQIQPSVSASGKLVWVGPAPGMSGSGGLWTGAPTSAESPLLVRAEETAYRARPRWVPGRDALVYVTDEGGTNDLALVAASGGNVLRLTTGPGHELTPAVDPTGQRIAFASSNGGPTGLYVVGIGGGEESAWTQVSTDERVYRGATGKLRGRLTDRSGRETAARISIVASDGRSYAPVDGFHKVVAATETHHFRARGAFTVQLPAGPATVSVRKGLEYQPVTREVRIEPDGDATVDIVLDRLVDPASTGWVGGDTHAHDLHQGRIPITREDFFQQLEAEDLTVTIALIHMDGTRLMGRWTDLTGAPSPLSTDRHKLQYAQEFRGSFGHVGMAGIQEFVTPFIGGATNTPWAPDVLNADYLRAAREQGGIGGFMHPFNGSVATPEAVSVSEIPVDAALGLGEFYDVICYWYDELANAEMYYRLLNAGFRIAATGGTDNFSDVWRDPGPGASRTYVRMDGPVTVNGWLDGIRSLHTFATNGPLLFTTVNGQAPGHEIRRQAGEAGPVEVVVDVASITPVSRVEVVLNGSVVHSEEVGERTGRFQVRAEVPVNGSAWVAVRALGPSSPLVSDSYAFAQTTPVWIVEGDAPFVSSEDVRFLLEAVEAFRGRITARDRFESVRDRDRFLARVDSAAAVYRTLLTRADATR